MNGGRIEAGDLLSLSPSSLPPVSLAAELPGSGGLVFFKFLDGIRGLMALNVLLYHSIGAMDAASSLPGWAGKFQKPFATGHLSVTVFIVLSGFSLMWPVARSSDGKLRGGLTGFFARRALRILPAYYAAVALGVVTCSLSGTYGSSGGSAALSWQSLTTHLLLVHNLSPVFAHSLNSAHWTVAMEWQIYGIFAVLLLPIWRYAGWIAAVCGAFAIPVAAMLLLPARWNFDWTAPWYIGLFAIGMAAATIDLDRIGRYPRQALAAICAGTGVVFLLAHHLGNRPGIVRPWISFETDAIFGLTTSAFILYCVATAADRGVSGWPGRLLGSRPLVMLGGMSYSLYLTHASLLDLSLEYTGSHGYTPRAAWALRGAVVVPACLALGYIWSRLFERPFMRRRGRAK